MNISSHNRSLGAIKLCLMCLLLTLATPPAEAQTAGKISIGGKVYGGGKEGAILSGNTTSDNSTAIESVEITNKDFRNSATAQASQVTINSGNIVGVFGGGEEGRAYGKTNVTVKNGTIGVTAQADIDKLNEATQRVNGNVFGAGDGNAAAVFGGSNVTIIGGRINGSVYGGGNEADLVGCSELDLQGGVYVGAVFGGARKSNIYGYTFVNIDGLNAKNDLHIIDVYGGNDIAGEIHPSDNWSWTKQSFLTVPFALANDAKLTNLASGVTPAEHVDNTWNAFILATEDQSANKFKTLVDNLYGGGNGDYDYETGRYAGLHKPEIERTYMQLEGGAYGNVYGGGNAATVTVSTDICLYNASTVNADYLTSLTGTKSEKLYTPDYQFNRVFGGNNKEPMAIRPNWYLEKATVNNLYSGGNAGPMTYFKQTSTGGAQSLAGDAGILIHVKSADMTINNVYGGCRMADVDPNGHKGADMTINAETIDGYNFPRNYAARVLIEGGNINNVYGGNDISGNVYYGSLVEIHSSINENVYGAGNGSYAYTDNVNLKGDKEYGDYYYDGGTGGLASARALSIYRPNAEQSYVHVTGTSTDTTYIGGAIYIGGNSATLRSQSGSLTDVNAELHIGSYVIADNVFLGSNGENMVKSALPTDLLQIYKNGPVGFSEYATQNSISGAYSSMDLTDSEQFEEYMSGVEVAIKPSVTFDAGYVSHSTKFGSLYCGGNVGSMSADGYFNVDFLQKLVIYNKLVGGCNNANVAKTDYNAFHMGGLTGNPDANNNKVLLTIAGLQLEPRVLTGNVKDGFNLDTWNLKPGTAMLQGGNIYGGCYSSGYINGGVNIDIQENTISPNVFPGSGVTYEEIRDDVLASTLAAYGGGYGKETEIWGNVTVSITGNGQIMKAYGGGEMGVVGRLDRDANGQYLTVDTLEWYPTMVETSKCDSTFSIAGYASKPHTVAKFADGGTYNTTVNLNANLLSDSKLNVAKLYAGGFQGTISGSTTLNLNQGRLYDGFGGASNADILGHAETYVGKTGRPWVLNNVYGANDFGGLIVGKKRFDVDNTNNEMEKVVAQTYVEYISGNIRGNLFGGPCGAYEYTDPKYATAIGQPGFCKPQLLENLLTPAMLIQHGGAGYGANSFVNVVSQSTLANDVVLGSIFGAGQGLKGHINSADERGSYVRLAAATTNQRTTGVLSPRVYGAGYCSNTNRSLVDAFTGYFGTIFGGAHGITYEELTTMKLNNPTGGYETNYMGYRSAVRLHDMVNSQMDIYGGGANAGAQETGVVLNGGQARNVYGASYAQGISYAASVEVPQTSTSKVHAIFGGAEGAGDAYPCDVYNTFITWNSANARVEDAIYGGNNAYRMTRNAYVSVSAPVKNFEDALTNVFGGGFGVNTVTLYTSVGLQDGAQVANVYGGGNNGKVLDTPSFRYYLDDGQLKCTDGTIKPDGDKLKVYPTSLDNATTEPSASTLYGYQKYLRDTEVIGFHDWIMANYWTDCRRDSRSQPLGSYNSNAHGHAHDLYFLSTQMDNMKNTNVFINKGALVAENAYGGGYGPDALVSGETMVHLWGGTVKGDIYGGGYGGHVEEFPHLIYPAGGEHEMTMSATYVDMQGGIARNVYGGGLNGRVTGSTNVVLGTKDQHENDFYGTTIRGEHEHRVIYGDPIVERSLYGGGQMGPVYGTAYLTINQGHVGYKYMEPDADAYDNASDSLKNVMRAAAYVENLDLNNDGDHFLDQNGNVFGAGYGEGASVDVTYVNIYGGTIRNSLYGGGEIAAVGRAEMASTGAHPVVDTITVPGRTHVYIYKGLVQGDVFGGGRGYSYDLTGNEVIGKVLYTDGYVFGTTEVEVRGGTIGTPATVEEGHGNVFGGGNIGYCFTDAAKHGIRGDGSGEGRYYTNAWKCSQCGHIEYEHDAPTVCGHCHKSTNATDDYFKTTFTQVDINGASTSENEKILSEDCRVVISPWAQVIAEEGIHISGNNKVQPDGSVLSDSTFAKGSYVPTAYLNLLKDKNTDVAQWNKLSVEGVTVRNAVFAGGNVSSGSDKVYANAYTVYGNATASVNDVFFRDLITLGTEHIGGLYGDGNLTFVDGYRELNITNFGTDYYGQQDHITLAQYQAMNDRERAYFVLEYQTKTNHTDEFYVCLVAGNYGTGDAAKDYVVGQHISVAEYSALPAEHKATSIWNHDTKTYAADAKIKESEWRMLSAEEQANWEMFGFCSIYAGRLLNTIQRADFCGVFGSRLVLQGAQDRVPEVVDYTQYTINRVGELSLNKKEYEGLDDSGMSAEHKLHGNYFGMYNIVNYLGAITSDVKFDDVRTTDNTNTGYKDPVSTASGDKAYGVATYYDWKNAHQADRKRNNGTCHNTVALAAGVYLEVVNEPKTAVSAEDRLDPYKKDWGYITGIVQLDLINVMPGLGGGYVYAKNEHGKKSGDPSAHENLSVYNKSAVNNSHYRYDEGNRELIETSGNFIHNVKQIVDDCFPGGGDLNSPAHYWYIRGEFYVYDQYISAFTGSSTAYSENINLPLTITAGANGRLDLIDIKQNYYAYYKEGSTPLGKNDAIVLNGITYGLNDVITYWDYMQLSDEQKAHFVKETYVATKDYCTSETSFDGYGNPTGVVEKGSVILPTYFETIKNQVVYDPEDIRKREVTEEPYMAHMTMADVFHVSNAVSHDNGYVLAVKLDNPGDWNTWYSPSSGPKKINQTDYKKPETVQTNYRVGPTYYTNTPGVYGQHEHVLDEIVTKTVVEAYTAIPPADIRALETAGKHQATVAAAYVAVTPAEYDYQEQHKNVQAGVGISAAEYESLSAENKAKFSPAYTCISTYEEDAASGKYVYFGELVSATKYQDYYNKYVQEYKVLNPTATDSAANHYAAQEMPKHFDNAYIVTEAGLYGGQHFEGNKNYRALDTWATLSAEDRTNFQFRYDALDVLLFSNTASSDPLEYYPATGEEGPGENKVNLYDGPYWTGTVGSETNPLHRVYGAKQPIDYTAKYNGAEPLTWRDAEGNEHTLRNTDSALEREAYEALPNERRHYSSFVVADTMVSKTFYIVKESFISGGTNYAAGKQVSAEVFNSFDQTRQGKIQQFTPTQSGTYYICRESYTINEHGEGRAVTDIRPSGTTYSAGVVPTGVIINSDNYNELVNKQLKGFTIHGVSPTETSTFYVNRESDINDLTQDRVVTVIYQYKYEESDESGQNVEEIIERHIINIHITFKSGVPTIGKLQDPSIVLPGQTVGLKQPGVTPGAYEILGGGWELFTNPEDAEKHTNGKTYVNNATPMYWYQDGYYVAYYAKTYLGKTYSNSVPFKVANYHDMAEVIAHPDYMYIDNPNVHRNSKIYISDDVHEVVVTPAVGETPAVTKEESEIDMLYDLFQASLETTKKTIYVDVQDQDSIDGLPQYWAVDPETGKPTTNRTSTNTGYPIHLYWQVDAAGNKDTTLPKTTTPTAYPATHKEERIVPVLDNHVRNLANLDFFLSEDVSTQKDGGWETIGVADAEHPENDLCFMGTLHGMGYTISGLQQSLFENLCGYVYNLGVTGSFTKSGIADNVSTGTVPDSNPEVQVHGLVNSSWIYTIGTIEGSLAEPILPVVGKANEVGNLDGMHVLNCYYPLECGYHVDSREDPNKYATAAPLQDFNNGAVTYDLNGFYLNKRYSDAVVTEQQFNDLVSGDKAKYKYWQQESDGTLKTTPSTGYYLSGGSMHAYDGQNLGYVERLFADGDFVYQHGTIPLETNERYSTMDSRYLPVWPDDYYFFGQRLTYGFDEIKRPYQPLPEHALKTISADGSGKDNRLVTTELSNVVYRTPAYFRSSEKQMVHFNPNAVFADSLKTGYTLSQADQNRGLTEAVLDGRAIHPGLTAIDFTGFNDRAILDADHRFATIPSSLAFSYGTRKPAGKPGYEAKYSVINDNVYFGPITDYTTIMSFETHGITQNLLAYAPTTTWSVGTANTQNVLRHYFKEPAYATYYSDDKYRKVQALDESTISGVHGHLVFKENTLARHYYYAESDHFLVDAQDFNAPIEYEFNSTSTSGNEYRMWYQRGPRTADNPNGLLYADINEGWEGVSLPFAAELVTTQQKGEITHFYKDRIHDGYNERYDSGHEYWLREFTGVNTTTGASPMVTSAVLSYPTANAEDTTKTATSTFLWDYYYNANGEDANGDDYRPDINNDGENEQDTTRYYYAQPRVFPEYPRSQAGKAYIAGFPGARYYEFDLSGTFVPEHSGDPYGGIVPAKLAAPQTITWVSNTGITIRVSDEECADAAVIGGYSFVPSYLNVVAPVSDEDMSYYVLNAVGSEYKKTAEVTPVVAFRPYFRAMGAAALRAPAVLGLSAAPESNFQPEVNEPGMEVTGSLKVYTQPSMIVVESGYEQTTLVRIVSMTGVPVATFKIEPGAQVTTPIFVPGIYMVNTTKVLVGK